MDRGSARRIAIGAAIMVVVLLLALGTTPLARMLRQANDEGAPVRGSRSAVELGSAPTRPTELQTETQSRAPLTGWLSVRQEAARLLQLNSSESQDTFRRLASNPYGVVRALAIHYLNRNRMLEEADVALTVHALDDPDWRVHLVAAEALLELHAPEGSDGNRRGTSEDPLARVMPNDAELQRRLDARTAPTRAEALQTLAVIFALGIDGKNMPRFRSLAKALRPIVVALIGDPNFVEAQILLLCWLNEWGPAFPELGPALLRIMQHDVDLSGLAAMAALRMGLETDAVLTRLARVKSPSVFGLHAPYESVPPPVVQRLRDSLESHGPISRLDALRLIAMLGPPAAAAFPSMIRPTSDDEAEWLPCVCALARVKGAAQPALDWVLAKAVPGTRTINIPGEFPTPQIHWRHLQRSDLRAPDLFGTGVIFILQPATEAEIALLSASAIAPHAPSVRRAALRLLSEGCARERAAAADCLTEPFAPLLRTLAHDRDMDVRGAAATALIHAGHSQEQIVPALAKVLYTGDDAAREFAARAIWQIASKSKPARDVLTAALASEDTLARTWVALLLAIGPHGKDPVSDYYGSFQRQINVTRATHGPQRVLEILADAAGDKDPRVRRLAAATAAVARFPDWRRTLAVLAKDNDTAVRELAEGWLKSIHAPDVPETWFVPPQEEAPAPDRTALIDGHLRDLIGDGPDTPLDLALRTKDEATLRAITVQGDDNPLARWVARKR